MRDIFNETTRQELTECKNYYSTGDCSEALECLARAVGISQDMGPMEILEAILALENGKEMLLVYYGALMYVALLQKGTLGRGLYRAWMLQEVEERLGKRRVTRPSPNAAVYPYCLIYWFSARAKEACGEGGKTSFNIAESGAFLAKKTSPAYLIGIAMMLERYAYTYSRIGAADVNKIIVMLEELLEEDLPWEYRNAFDLILPELEQVKLMKNIKQQKQKLLQLAKLLPIPYELETD